MKAKAPFCNPWLWPILATTYVGEVALQAVSQCLNPGRPNRSHWP